MHLTRVKTPLGFQEIVNTSEGTKKLVEDTLNCSLVCYWKSAGATETTSWNKELTTVESGKVDHATISKINLFQNGHRNRYWISLNNSQ